MRSARLLRLQCGSGRSGLAWRARGERSKPKASGIHRPVPAGIAFAVGAVLPADNADPGEGGQVAAQGAFGHPVEPLHQLAVRGKHDGAVRFGWQCALREKRQQRLQDAKGAVAQFKFRGGVRQRSQKVPLVVSTRQPAARILPPKCDLGRLFHDYFHERQKIPAPMQRMELTLRSLKGYSKGAKSENGLLGCNVLGGFSFACLRASCPVFSALAQSSGCSGWSCCQRP